LLLVSCTRRPSKSPASLQASPISRARFQACWYKFGMRVKSDHRVIVWASASSSSPPAPLCLPCLWITATRPELFQRRGKDGIRPAPPGLGNNCRQSIRNRVIFDRSERIDEANLLRSRGESVRHDDLAASVRSRWVKLTLRFLNHLCMTVYPGPVVFSVPDIGPKNPRGKR
jgi:hypothetical protein